MKLNKKNLCEYIGYFSIALVCVLSLVLSFGIVELYQQPIVANAAVAVEYPNPTMYMGGYIPSLSDYDLLSSSAFAYGDTITEYLLPSSVIYPDGLSPVVGDVLLIHIPWSSSVNGYFYSLTYHLNNNSPSWGGIYVARRFSFNAQGTGATLGNTTCSLIQIQGQYSSDVFDGLLFKNYYTESYNNTSTSISVFLLRPKDDTSNAFADSFFSSIGDGISFGFESLTTGITYTMDNLFLIDGELSDFSIMLFLLTGVSLAMAVLKFILGFVFNWRDKS